MNEKIKKVDVYVHIFMANGKKLTERMELDNPLNLKPNEVCYKVAENLSRYMDDNSHMRTAFFDNTLIFLDNISMIKFIPVDENEGEK